MFVFNYDWETVSVSPEVKEYVLFDYYAPTVDPFPHHIVLKVDTTRVVEITQIKDNETSIIYTDSGSGRFTVYPGETINVVLRNPDEAQGEVKTVFYRDSWTYSTYASVSLASLSFILGIREVGEKKVKEL